MVPVPEVLGPDDVATVDAGIFDVLDGYSAPRLVSYTCDDFMYDEEADFDSAEDGATGGGGGADGVTVESAFVVGSYEIVVLSAEESSGLLTWLETNGYNGLDESAEALLDEYISGGQYFFAAKVFLDAVPEDAAYLEPLQVSYSAEAFSLPIRLGTLNAPPEAAQDLYVYVLTDSADGSVGISNYPQATIEDECLWREDAWPNFGEFWTSKVTNAREEAGGAVWIQEYTWNTGWCDPCSGDPPNDEQVQLLGFEGDAWETHFTRLHVQYTAEAADQELMLYTSNISDSEQIRYIIYEKEFEDLFPICGEDTPTSPVHAMTIPMTHQDRTTRTPMQTLTQMQTLTLTPMRTPIATRTRSSTVRRSAARPPVRATMTRAEDVRRQVPVRPPVSLGWAWP